jgi:hypothetical protein
MQPSTSERPRFRQDLVAEPIEDNGARFIDVMAPDSGTVFRFYEVEFSLACAMDGERDIGGIVRWAREELGMTVVPKEVTTMIATLGELGYLDQGAAAAAEIDHATVVDRQRTVVDSAAPETVDAAKTEQQELAPGILASMSNDRRGAPLPASDDIELGHARTQIAEDREAAQPVEVALGRAGASRAPSAPPAPVEDIPLGTSGRGDTAVGEEAPARDVSLDLAADVAIGPADVKEAVRQSQVMRAVDIPPDLLAAVEPVVSTEQPPVERVERQPPPPEPRPVPEPRVETRPEPRAKPEPRPEPRVEKRAPEPRVEKRAPEPKPPVPTPPEPRRGVSPVLIVLLVLTVVGAGAFFVYKYVIDKDDSTSTSESTPAPKTAPPIDETKPQPPPQPPPPPPPPEVQKLATEQPPAIELKASTPQTLEAFLAKEAVKRGDQVAVFVGHTGTEKQIAALQKDIERVQGEVEKAQKALDAARTGNNPAAVKDAEAKLADRKRSLDDKQKTVVTRSAELEKYVLLAPTDGKFVAVAKLNTRVTPADVVARIERPALLVATFKRAANAAKGASVFVKPKDGNATVCRIDDVDGSGAAKVACPSDVLKEGQEVTFAGVSTAVVPKKEEEIEMGSDSGSSGSAKKAP